MKNDEFRKLVSSASKDDGSPSQKPGATPALGAKKSSFVGMTPRPGKAPSSTDFARQIRERHASLQPTKKFKSYAPKGSKFAAGYTDRAKARQEAQEDEDDKAERIKALEEQVKLGQLPQETFEALRDKITGGDASSTHLVKGLDRQLLERVRRGEDVLGLSGDKAEDAPPDVDDELDKLEEQDVETVTKEKSEKKGTKATQPVAGVKRSRDEIMAELKAQRKAAAEVKAASAPTFDSRWRKLGEEAKPKIEIDRKGREVLITVDENGVVKKKVRKLAADADDKAAIEMPDASKPVLGADVVVPERKLEPEPEEDDDDIFEGAGTEYNPLGDMEDDDSGASDDDADEEAPKGPQIPRNETLNQDNSDKEAVEDETKTKAPPAQAIPGPRNYFKDTSNDTNDAEADRFKGIENVLKKASKIGGEGGDDEDGDDSETKEEREARLAKRAKMLASQDRDMEDMDFGFGSSRFEDEEDGESKKQRLSQWKGGATADDEGWEEGEKDTKKKRKPKKRKGDVNNADDIMRVIEGRKKAESK